jgi:SAM-dependent methyltransferase
MSKPLFSILHTSARPDKWRAVYDDWMSKAVHPEDVEYVLCVDPRWGFSTDPNEYAADLGYGHQTNPDNLVVVQNTGRRCYVDGVNIAARASSGSILIVNADDQFACEGWDEKLAGVVEWEFPAWVGVPTDSRLGKGGNGSFVIEVSTGTPAEHDRAILVMPILSRKRYEDQGYEVFWHEYESMCADNDFCEHARQDGVVIDARHLMFPHVHPSFNELGWVRYKEERQGWDAAYEMQNRPEAMQLGKEILTRRRASNFANVPARRSIALCLSGEQFQGVWVDALLSLYGHLIDLGFNVLKLRGCSTNVYQMREEVRRAVLDYSPRPDLCLWIDDDNPLSPEHFDRLLSGLDAHPEVDGVSGWCWIHNSKKGGFMPSCGEWAPDGLHWNPFHPRLVNETELKPFDVGGLPCMLMRTSCLDKVGDGSAIPADGKGAFLPIMDSRFEHGMSGEDVAFFYRAEILGCKFLVDPQVRVPHLKYVEVEPILPEEGAGPPVKVACMMRVKNEGRWLKRVIESVRPLCGDNIFVMEDGSTDDTVGVIEAAGVHYWESPFIGEGLDERRDKNWLLEQVKKACRPDWILMPDGDEELEPGGAEKIRRALETHPPVDGFTLRILNLWNSVDTVRLDGVYGTMARQSLFRANSDLEFQPCYPGGNENHVVLHVSNAPGLGGPRLAPLNVNLLHYGYLYKEDRVRKYKWIVSIDPANKEEDYYKHTVLGDYPSLPASSKLKHAGPLLLQKLPARLVPKWDVVPGPFVTPEMAKLQDEVFGPVVEPLPGGIAGMWRAQREAAASVEVADTRFDGAYHLSKLNLGCCDRKLDGYVGVDLHPGPAVDVVADLSKPWPWADESVAAILAHDVIEHLPDKIRTMNEAWRVLKTGGTAEIVVPTTDGPGAFQDPTHVSFWHRNTFWYFEARNLYRERFAGPYGIQARFKVLSEDETITRDGPKLKILLEKVS